MRRASTVVDYLLYGSSALGLALSTLLSVRGLATFPSPIVGNWATLSEWVLFGLFPVGFVFVARYQSLTRDITPREADRMRYMGCPRWMRRTAYCLMGAGAILFFLPGILELTGHAPKVDYSSFKEFPSTALGGFGLIVYGTFFAQLYSLRAQSVGVRS